MSATKRENLSGWGQYPRRECLSYRPEKQRELATITASHTGPILARGLGRSYGDAALQPDGIIQTTRLDHFIGFDTTLGIVTAQAGVTLADIMDMAVPRGWILPVIPGTRHVTIGGAVACNVHGKNQFKSGDFAEHVLSIRLLMASGESVDCSPQENTDLFWATAGGMGMTGIIESVSLQLRRIDSCTLSATSFCVDDIEEMVEAFQKYRGTDYMVGWIDHMAKGSSIGKGVFEAALHISTHENGWPVAEYEPLEITASIPLNAPSWLLNRYSMALYNKFRFSQYSSIRQTETVGFNGFFHPLDRIKNWNKLYGKRGFFQYQCLIPDSPTVAESLREFLELIHLKNCFSFLAVIKYHRASTGYLGFSKPGYSIALDFPNTFAVRSLLPELNQWIADRGGNVYLAKDTSLTPELFRSMYPHAQEWLLRLVEFDPHSRFTSLMSDRLQWKQPV